MACALPFCRALIEIAGLSFLCQRVLLKHLPKPPEVRCSNWSTSSDLTRRQIDYAALDAYAGVQVYSELVKKPNYGQRLCAPRREGANDDVADDRVLPSAGLQVDLMPSGSSDASDEPVAAGRIAEDQPALFKNINNSRTRVLITIEQVLTCFCCLTCY